MRAILRPSPALAQLTFGTATRFGAQGAAGRARLGTVFRQAQLSLKLFGFP
jgi:hypothetical protein